MAPMMDTLKQLVGGATSAIVNLRKAESGIRERLAELEREESRLLTQLEPLDAVEASYKAQIADLGTQWIRARGVDIVRAGSGRIERGLGPVGERPPDVVVPGRLMDVLGGPQSLEADAALMPDILLAGLMRVARATHYESGPMGSRLVRLSAIETERQTLQQRHAELVDEAAAAGVTLEHLAEERAHRLQVAQRHATWADDQRANRDYYKRTPSASPPEPPRPTWRPTAEQR